MTKKHEELVEGVANYLRLYIEIHEDMHYGKVEREEQIYWSVGHIITLILSAVRDGLELPGEVGRTEIDVATAVTSGLLAFFQTWVREAVTQKGAKVLIALTGTAKEEENNADSAGQRDQAAHQ